MAIGDVFRTVMGAGRHHMSSHSAAKRQYDDAETARAAFADRRRLLLDVNQWSRLAGVENANFALYDETGCRVYRHEAAVGDFVAIDLPVAGLLRTDWVRIERIEQEPSRVAVCVRPSHDPTRRPLADHVTAHFFTREAVNTFTLERRGPWLFARVDGRDECANVGDECDNPQLAISNRMLAEGGWGAKVPIPGTPLVVKGLQQHQWDRFTHNLVAD